MAGGMDLGGGARSGKKPLDAVINLVPFIDLMAVTIAFLLITAVWTQTGAQPVTAPGSGEGAEAGPALTLRLTGRDVTVTFGSVRTATYPLAELERLGRELTEAHATSATVEPDDDVRYEDLVHVIDACRGAGIEGVAVAAPAG